ncbi:MAG: putative manganese-dependent inorganic diphosphatase [Victivallales bacterium]|jgi:manganese-dependent inorganic pyrophosphatase|nr:putative manganese-dependent inorganic diphosphatase [Victivallales bacterium]
MTPNEEPKLIFVSGHRNADIDSIAGAYALAELRRRQTKVPVAALCPGILPDRAKYLFERFGQTPPECRNDIYLRIRDILEPCKFIQAGSTLFEAVNLLRESGMPRLPVIKGDGKFLGMLSSLSLLSQLLNIGSSDGSDLAGRRIHSSIDLIVNVLEAEILTGIDTAVEQDFDVYVAAMGVDSFEEHIPSDNRDLALIVGDRPEIHLRALHRDLRLLIITGRRPIDPLILKEAAAHRVSILRTELDSATVIRRLKFSTPVEFMHFPGDELILSPDDRLRDLRNRIFASNSDVLPVIDQDNHLLGIVLKKRLSEAPPYRMILVDHNEPEQSLPGVEELPIIEIVDHHRIGMMPTAAPIRFTADIVGSSCTLIAMMYRSSGESLSSELAGLLLGGIVSDTLLLKSPTTAPLDRRMCEWLEKLSVITGEELMNELMQIDSPLAVKPAVEVIGGDCKIYTDGDFRFALSQVEETNLELLHRRSEELAEEIHRRMETDGLAFFGLLVTDAVRENSELLAFGDENVIRDLPYAPIGKNLFALPGVLSRKKQLLPQILAITATLRRE